MVRTSQILQGAFRDEGGENESCCTTKRRFHETKKCQTRQSRHKDHANTWQPSYSSVLSTVARSTRRVFGKHIPLTSVFFLARLGRLPTSPVTSEVLAATTALLTPVRSAVPAASRRAQQRLPGASEVVMLMAEEEKKEDCPSGDMMRSHSLRVPPKAKGHLALAFSL